MERDQEDFYQTHMIVGGDAIYVFRMATHTQAEKCKPT